MKVKDVKNKINCIENCQKALEIYSETEKELFYKDMFKCSDNLLNEYKLLLLNMMEEAEVEVNI